MSADPRPKKIHQEPIIVGVGGTMLVNFSLVAERIVC
jgi:hypothetical protein